MSEHYDKIDKTWKKICSAIASNHLPGCSADCTTMRYNPTKFGPGPSTSGVICVNTDEHNVDSIGFEIVKIVKHDIHCIVASMRQTHGNSAHKTIYWNGGKPEFVCREKKYSGIKDEKKDIWHLNVVNARGPIGSLEASSFWEVQLVSKELTKMWHSIKDVIESECNTSMIKMECPLREAEYLVFHVFTNAAEHNSVFKMLIQIIKRDINADRQKEVMLNLDYVDRIQGTYCTDTVTSS